MQSASREIQVDFFSAGSFYWFERDNVDLREYYGEV